jgi:hypothetical protein
MTKKQLLKFIAIRNKSGFASNLQFELDASQCGFSTDELGPVSKVGLKDAPAYHWETEHGTLIEYGGKLELRT